MLCSSRGASDRILVGRHAIVPELAFPDVIGREPPRPSLGSRAPRGVYLAVLRVDVLEPTSVARKGFSRLPHTSSCLPGSTSGPRHGGVDDGHRRLTSIRTSHYTRRAVLRANALPVGRMACCGCPRRSPISRATTMSLSSGPVMAAPSLLRA